MSACTVASPIHTCSTGLLRAGSIVHTYTQMWGPLRGWVCYRSCILENDSRRRLGALFLMSNKITSLVHTEVNMQIKLCMYPTVLDASSRYRGPPREYSQPTSYRFFASKVSIAVCIVRTGLLIAFLKAAATCRHSL